MTQPSAGKKARARRVSSMCVMYNPFVCTYGGGGMLDPHNWRAKDVDKMVKTFFG